VNLNTVAKTAVVALALSANALAVGPYLLTDLGAISPNGEASASAINNLGQVTGSTRTIGQPFHAFLWTPTSPNAPTGSQADIGLISAGDFYATGMGINSFGQVAGYGYELGLPFDGFVWTPNSPNGSSGVMRELGHLDPPLPNTLGAAVDAQGRVVGRSRVASHTVATIWNPTVPNGTTGALSPLAGLPAQFTDSDARDINTIGQITGSGYASGPQGSGPSRAYVWNPTIPNGSTGSAIIIDELLAPTDSSSASAVNDYGQVVGAFGQSVIEGRAYVWTPNSANGTAGAMKDLGLLPGIPHARANDINALGQVVGTATNISDTFRAFVWTPAAPNSNTGTMIDLNTIVDPISGAGWTLFGASGINDSGQIVGSGLYDPDGLGGVDPIGRAFLLTPVPEPTAVCTLAMAAALTLAFRKRRVAPRHN
jgi:probable HAF family extracellular repeat protein